MPLQLFFHPFSSYSQKALIALYENDTPFTPRVLSPEDPATGAEFARRWPLKRFPILVDGERTILEASTVIEYLDAAHPGPVRLIPQDPLAVQAVFPVGCARSRLSAVSRVPRRRRPR